MPAQVRMWNDLPYTVFDTRMLDWFKSVVVSGQTKTLSDAKIILLVHKITGYNTINKILTLRKYELIMWLTDIKRAGLAVIYPWLIARVKDPKS